MKVSRQKSFIASCTCRPSQKTFTESLILSLKSILEQRHLELSYKKVSWTCKKVRKLQNFSALKFLCYTVVIAMLHVVLQDFIISDLKTHYDLAVSWLYHEYARDTEGDQYDLCLTSLLEGAKATLEPRDRLVVMCKEC